MGNENSSQIIETAFVDESINCFSNGILNSIFKKSSVFHDRLISRESRWLEFKKSFNWNSRAYYARTCAAFANTNGGYLVFGVDSNPHKLIGLQSANFDEIDPSVVSAFFNEYLSPEIEWSAQIYEFEGQKYGIIFISEIDEKPIICTKTIGDAKDLKEGEIYYRYNGRTSVIRYPELRSILEEGKQKEKRIWLEYLSRIARIGVREAGIIDLESGEITDASGTHIVSKSILPNLNYIKEGEFKEIEGQPAIKVSGESKIGGGALLPTTQTIYRERPIAIHAPEIIGAFLNQENVMEPKEYLKAICFESSAFLPIYYFMKLSNLKRDDTKNLIQETKSTSQAKNKLIHRLDSDKNLKLSAPKSNTDVGKKKLEYLKFVLQKDFTLVSSLSGKDLNYFLQVIRTLNLDQIDVNFLRSTLLQIFAKYYGDKSANLSSDIRVSVCFLDFVLYGKEVA